jgi:TolB protein
MTRQTFLPKILFALFLAWSALLSTPTMAQFRVEVSGVGLTQVPVAVADFRGEGSSPQKISRIIQGDLERSGQFTGIETSGTLIDETTRPDFSYWKQKSADALVVGSVTRLADGRYDVRYRLWDSVKNQDLGGRSLTVTAADLRLAAHQIADIIYEKLTGEKGVFATRISYVTKSGPRYTLWVADSDGQGANSALSSSEPIISPSWSPLGNQLAYVSFESRKPVIYTHQVQSGQRFAVANFKGSNSAPAWAPDARSLVVTLSRDGNSQIFNVDANGSEPRRLSQSNGIDTEAVYSADGKSLYFVSDRGGSPQIYRMPAGGGSAERVTFTGSYNISPSASPDGRYLAYIARVSGNAYRLTLLDLTTGVATALSDTWSDERPSFAPNSKLILYATRINGREVLMTTTLDGKVKAKLSAAAGDIREPSWGPLVR